MKRINGERERENGKENDIVCRFSTNIRGYMSLVYDNRFGLICNFHGIS